MPRPDAPGAAMAERVTDVDVSTEMRHSFLEYAYSVIYQRALPDARDGLKPVQRRILYQMNQMGLRPDRGHVKCARVVGEVMGRLHPHGDAAIYDALVRMAQPWAMRIPLVDGHGNFGSLGGDDAPAAMRYTEARLAPPALLLVQSIEEDTVGFRANYDGQEQEPEVLPAAFPNLLVNGASGIAVGMATNMAPHNLGEVIAAARHLIKYPQADLDALVRFIPGPDLPTGGRIIGLDGIREAYETGRGSFRVRATAEIENISPRRTGIVITELPYAVGPERVIARIAELAQAKKIAGISDVRDLTDRSNGLRLVIELKNGFNADGVLEELYRLTPLEETFGINNVALVDGQPRTLGLKELLSVYVDHRIDVVRRRSAHRRQKRAGRLHLVDGLITALLDIDEVIQVIRSSEDAGQAKQRLMAVFDLSEAQASYILDTPLRRLTKYDRLELERERDTLRAEIAELTEILESESTLREVVADELAEVATAYTTPRRTVLLASSGMPQRAAVPLEVTDDPCFVLMSSTGLLARTTSAEPLPADGPRSAHDVIVSAATATARGTIGAVTTHGRMAKINVLDLPALPPRASPPSLAGGVPVRELLQLGRGEEVVAVVQLDHDGPGVALGTERGVVKRVVPDYPSGREDFAIIGLRDGDHVVGAAQLATDEEDLVFITSDAHLLRFPATQVRPQGRGAAGMAGVRLNAGARAVWFGAVNDTDNSVVATIAGDSTALPGTQSGAVKIARYADFPPKGRATGGVRCHRFRRGEDALLLAWAGHAPVVAAGPTGKPIALPDDLGRRDGSGSALPTPIAAVGGRTASCR